MKDTDKYERKNPLGSTAIQNALEERKQTSTDALIAGAKQNYRAVSDANDNSQLNKYLYPPFTNESRNKA
jgi:hypothetical protein